jgi:hypothetical protein
MAWIQCLNRARHYRIGGTALGTGVMQRIGTLLSEGKSSRELIDLGYASGTVYKVQREFRSGSNAPVLPVSNRSGSSAPFTQVQGFTEVRRDDGSRPYWVWHSPQPVPCPGCSTLVEHWDLCGDCNRLLPADCRCERASNAVSKGFGLTDLLDGAHRVATLTV